MNEYFLAKCFSQLPVLSRKKKIPRGKIYICSKNNSTINAELFSNTIKLQFLYEEIYQTYSVQDA